MLGAFQGENAALAIAAVEALDPGGERIGLEAVRLGLARAALPGRLELIPAAAGAPCPIMLDGAHNPDKLAAMLDSVRQLQHRRLHVVYGALGHRAPDLELTKLAARATTFVATEPSVYQKAPRTAAEVAAVAAGGSPEQLALERDPRAATDIALAEARPGDLVLITGSLYLCGQVRGRWYPDAEVLRHRTSWF
jgi:folylpolyglutamate synthase/dihydropteroate synthase